MTKRLPERRTALITAGGIAAVIVAGAFAVGANLGILDASSDNQIGDLAAAGDLVPTTERHAGHRSRPSRRRRRPPPPRRTSSTSPARSPSIATGDTLVVSAVGANPGWTWTPGPSDATHVELTFTDGVRSLVFTATRAADGSIDASVDETASGTASAATATTAPSSHDDPTTTTTTRSTTTSTKDAMTMTDPDVHDHAVADAQRARVEALRQRRAPRVDASASPAAATGPAPRRKRRRHAAGRSRVGVAAFSVATHARPRRRHGPRPAGELGDADRPGRHHRRAAAGADSRRQHRGAGRGAGPGDRRAARGVDGPPDASR